MEADLYFELVKIDIRNLVEDENIHQIVEDYNSWYNNKIRNK